MSKKTGTIPFKRRLKGKTNYKKRLAMLKSGKARLVVRKSGKHFTVQIVKYKNSGDETLTHISTKHLKKYGWIGKSNIPSAYLCGYLAAKKALKAGIKEAILDIGMLTPMKKGTTFAVLKGALDAGLSVPHSEDALPEEERVKGKHIEAYANTLDEKELNIRFGKYLKEGVDPKKLSEYFLKAKEKIDQEYAGE